MFFQVKSKRAVSVMVGYVLLITFAAIIGIIVYQWMKTYIPQEDLNCPDGVSIFIEDYTCSLNTLTLNFKNNGKFSIGGYFIYVTDSPEEELAIIELSKNNTDASSIINNVIKFGEVGNNSLKPNEKQTDVYTLVGINNIYSVEILPIRWQKEKNRNILVSCKDAKIRETIECGELIEEEECIPNCEGKVCGSDGCEGTCEPGCADPTPNCIDYQCSALSCIPTCVNKECGSDGCEGTCGTVCALDNSASQCNATYMCEILTCNENYGDCDLDRLNGCEIILGTDTNCASCGDVCTAGVEICSDGSCTSCNGAWTSSEDLGIECDGGTLCLDDCTCTEGYESDELGGCKIPSYVNGCDDYCVWLTTPVYTDGTCRQNDAQCTKYYETWNPAGDSYCDVALTSFCCCLA